MSASMYPTIEFNFIAVPDSNKSNSRLNIKKCLNGNLQWKFEQGCHPCETIELTTEEDVNKRMRMMFGMLDWDNDPFENVLMHFPGFPAVQISMTNANDAFIDITRMISVTFENWASTVEMDEDDHICDNRICDDDDDDDDSAGDEMPPLIPFHTCSHDLVDYEDDEYSDMPPLVPINSAFKSVLPPSPICEVECECGPGQCAQMQYASRNAPFHAPERQNSFMGYYNEHR